MVYEYSNGVRIINDSNYRPRQFPYTPQAFCESGATPDIAEFRDRRDNLWLILNLAVLVNQATIPNNVSGLQRGR